MVDEPEAERPDEHKEEEGGPVKSFLEHLEDLRWVLIKSVVALGMAMLICLMAGNHVVLILKRPLDKAKISYPGTNQVLTLLFGTNRFGFFPPPPEKKGALNPGNTNLFFAVHIDPATLGTNQILSWRVDNDPRLAESAQKLKIDLLNLSPAAG